HITGILSIAQDISQRKRLEAAERDQLFLGTIVSSADDAIVSAKDEFLATISHELRTPITAILGWSRMMMTEELTDDRMRQAIQTIDRNSRIQAQLIQDLLDTSRIVSGRLRLEFKPLDVPSVINAAVEALTLAAEAKEIRIRTVLSSGAGPILGDADRLQQVV